LISKEKFTTKRGNFWIRTDNKDATIKKIDKSRKISTKISIFDENLMSKPKTKKIFSLLK